MGWIVDAMVVIAGLGNLGLCVWWQWELRRVRRLERLLGCLCIQAMVEHHAPYWEAWQRAFGYQIEVRLTRRERTDQ